MNYLNGGYAMIKHNASQAELANAYKTKKPILLYDENGFAYWARITETTSIVDDETIYTYDVVKINQIENLVDSAGNPRFIEGDGEPLEQEGVNITYCKWSLSGTHLMLVVAGTIANATIISNNTILVKYAFPDYIKNKIYPVWDNNLEVKQVPMYANDWTTQNLYCKFQKITTGLQIQTGALTLTAERSFRAQFDLLIDADYSE